MFTAFTLRGALPVLERAMFCGWLIVPTACGPNVRLEGDNDTTGTWSTTDAVFDP